ALAFGGWITQETGDKLGSTIGKTAAELLQMADSRGFKPVSLPVQIAAVARARMRGIESANVVARIEGSDPKRKDEAVVFSAHWDHFGIAEAVNGDTIYNGAVDNASGCGMLLELARAWAALPQRPRRSAIFLVTTGEEEGLLGSSFYALHPAAAA